MGNRASNTRINFGGRRYCTTKPNYLQNTEVFDECARTANNGKILFYRGYNDTPTVEHSVEQSVESGRDKMKTSWFKMLVKLWKGELIQEERDKTSLVIQYAERVTSGIKGRKAMLDGEDEWLRKEGETCHDDK